MAYVVCTSPRSPYRFRIRRALGSHRPFTRSYCAGDLIAVPANSERCAARADDVLARSICRGYGLHVNCTS